MTISTTKGALTKRVFLLATMVIVAAFALTTAAEAQGDSPWDPPQSIAPERVATDIVTGTVIAIADVETATSIHTVATIAVSDRELGDAPDEIQVEVLGGVYPDGSRLAVSHQPTFDIATTVRLVLTPATAQEQADLGAGMYSILGGERGLTLFSDPVIVANASNDYELTGERQASFPTSFSLVSGVSPALEVELVAGAFEWDIATCSTINFTYSGEATGDPFNVDGVNMIGPSDSFTGWNPGDLAVAFTLTNASNIIVEWDIIFNVDATSFSIGAVPGSYDWRSVQRHEIGHVLGLGHVETGNSIVEEIMFPRISQNTVKFLGTGDRTGATLLYPAHPFTDITPLTYFERPVAWLAEEGITTGITPTTYGPGGPVTRSQMATFLYRLAGSPAVTGSHPFTDVPAGQFYSTPVLWLEQSGITTGTTPTTFSPNGLVTRGQMATFLYRAAGSPPVSGSHPFTDVPNGVFYTTPITWLSQQGITTGLTPTTFGPNNVVNRAQMATFLHRFAGEPQTC